MKRFAAFLLVLAMILSLAIPAFAAGNGKITVTNAQAGETYAVYQMFELSVDSETDPKAYTYTINPTWAAFFAEGGAGKQYITVNDAGAVTAVSDAAALAKAASAWAGKPAATQSIIAAADSVEFTGLDNGYWLITSTLGTLAMIDTTPDKNEVKVNEKNSTNIIEKQVKEDSTGLYGDGNDAQVGDTIEFQSTVTIVKNTRNVVVHDDMTPGLTFDPDSLAIAGLTQGTEYTVDFNPKDGDDFEISFTQSWIDSLDFGNDGVNSYVITYTATLNKNAVVKNGNGVALVDQSNKTYVSFGNDSKSTYDETITHTHKFNIYKHASGVDKHLAGAEFQLKQGEDIIELVQIDKNDPHNYRVAKPNEEGAVETFTTVDSGDIVIWGVDKDTYTLVEINAPYGYNKLDEPITVKVDGANATRIVVANQSGTELPSTGGVGTTMFYIFGGILVLAAVVLLVTKKRMAVAE